MIIYGTKEVHLESMLLDTTICKNCQEKGNITLSVFGKHLHIFWIPLFPIMKKGYSQCSHCKNILEAKEMPDSIRDKYKKLKKEAKYKIWQYIGIILIILLFFPSVLSLSSYMINKDKNLQIDQRVYTTNDGKIGFYMENYKVSNEKNPYDLFCENGEAYMGVFVFNTKNIASDITKKDILNLQITNLISKRKNAKEVVGLKEIPYRDKTIYQKIYTADKDYGKYMYIFNIIDFGKKEDTFAYVIFSTSITYGEKHINDFTAILKTGEIFK